MDSALFNARLKARQEQEAHERQRKLAHVRVAALLSNEADASSVVAYAKQQIGKWRRQSLCSADYIDAWSELLRQPKQAAQVLLEDSPRAMRLRQNSPFAAYLAT